jgi:AcrR family transcriptional regulator
MEGDESPGRRPPAPPWVARREPARRRAGKPPLSREVIVETAIAVLDREGAEAMTMRRVAQELGTGPASLYAHVANLRDLEDLVFDRVAAELSVPEPDPERWQEQLAQLLFDSVLVLRRHSGVARYALGRVPMGEHALAFSDAMLGLLRVGGVPDQAAAWAVDMVGLFIAAAGYEEAVMRAQGSTEESMREWVDQFAGYLANLPAERYPNMVRLAGPLATGTGDERLRFGVEMLVAGIAATVPKS